jgi:hypothetical protein
MPIGFYFACYVFYRGKRYGKIEPIAGYGRKMPYSHMGRFRNNPI